MKEKKLSIMTKWLGGFLICMILVVIYNASDKKYEKAKEKAKSYSVPSYEQPNQKKLDAIQKDRSIMAYIMIENYITPRLVSPSTADFQGIFSGRTVYKVGNLYSTHSYVDSQNKFGAMIRTNFVAQIKYLGSDNWKMVTFTPQK